MILCWAVKCGQSCMQMNGGKLVMHPETDVVVNFHWPHLMSPTLAWLSCQSWYILTTDFTPQHQRNRDWVGEKMLKVKAFNSNTFCHIYLDIFAHSKCIGFKQLCQRDLVCFFFKCSFSGFRSTLNLTTKCNHCLIKYLFYISAIY